MSEGNPILLLRNNAEAMKIFFHHRWDESDKDTKKKFIQFLLPAIVLFFVGWYLHSNLPHKSNYKMLSFFIALSGILIMIILAVKLRIYTRTKSKHFKQMNRYFDELKKLKSGSLELLNDRFIHHEVTFADVDIATPFMYSDIEEVLTFEDGLNIVFPKLNYIMPKENFQMTGDYEKFLEALLTSSRMSK